MEYPQKELVTVEVLAQLLGKRPQALREAICRGTAPWAIWLRGQRIRFGRRQYFRREDIDQLLELGDEVVTFAPAPQRHRG